MYALGDNVNGQLGDRTSITRTTWVNARNPDDYIVTDAAWISANEHDASVSGFAVIRLGGKLYTAGSNSFYMIGRDSDNGVNFLNIPNGVSSTDVITHAEVGGHSTALVRLGSVRYGYVGHRIDGSMGDGTLASNVQETFDFVTPPIVAICGTICNQVTLAAVSQTICPGSDAVFNISGTPGDIVSYRLNNGITQTATIGANGSVLVAISAPSENQNINLTFVLGEDGECSNFLTLSASINVSNNITPEFAQVASICSGATLAALPTTSINGITGTWAPPINSSQTTTYTFTPTIQGTCITNAQMPIGVLSVTVPTFAQVGAICEGTNLQPLPLTSLNGIEGTWSPALNNLETMTYSFVPNGGSCIDLTTMTITVTPRPTPTFTQVPAICEGNTLADLPTISFNGLPGVWLPPINNTETTTYNFKPTDVCAFQVPMTITVTPRIDPVFSFTDAICFANDQFEFPTTSDNGILGSWSPKLNNTQSATYNFTPDPAECANSTSNALVVFDDFDFEYVRYCQNGQLFLEVLPTLQSFDSNAAQYNWQLNSTNIGSDAIFNVTSYLSGTTINESMPISFGITVTTIEGCPKSKIVTLPSVYCGIQKGISPNNDGLNDFFDLRLLDVQKLSIFNRYGTKVYSKDSYTEEWRGQDNNGNMLPDATYYFVIDFIDTPSKTGWIYISWEN